MAHPEAVSRNVLVADDSVADQEVIRRAFALTNLPIRLDTVEDGEQALSFLGLEGEAGSRDPAARLPDLLLLDLNLPRLSGKEVLKAIRNSDLHRHLPVLILSGSDYHDDVLWCYRHGCNGYVQKSDFRIFREDIGRLAQFWLNTALLPG